MPVADILSIATDRPPDGVLGVGQPHTCCAVRPKYSVFRPVAALDGLGALSLSWACGVGHPVQPLSNVRRADARSAQIGGPAGISCAFQVSTNSGEPLAPILSRNLLSKDRCRPALGDEAVKSGPEVSFVGMAFVLSCARNRLTRAGTSPDWFAPAGEAKGKRPASDAGEEMALVVAGEVTCANVGNASFVNVSGRNEPCRDEVAEPRCGMDVNLVVVRGHGHGSCIAASWLRRFSASACTPKSYRPACREPLAALGLLSCDQILVQVYKSHIYAGCSAISIAVFKLTLDACVAAILFALPATHSKLCFTMVYNSRMAREDCHALGQTILARDGVGGLEVYDYDCVSESP